MLIKGFPVYGVTLTYADFAHFPILFSSLAGPNSKMCRICISQRDAIEMKLFSDHLIYVANEITLSFPFDTLDARTKILTIFLLVFQKISRPQDKSSFFQILNFPVAAVLPQFLFVQ